MQVNYKLWRVDLGKKVFWLKNSSKNSSGYFELWNLRERENKEIKNKEEKENDRI
ncbi:hypothetical protein [Athalassotoga saccharophila]|uniref:hypothetical protein n=1 Tax=Athalassotoga saccharophila TaxID=1441386 RepID=UPI0013796703|nr:hypothetical protein [Athalassotoga saccharophila]BBJ27507.1 hypothetical protein ATHSA_0376 [Athalassotoga saccharophila]